MIWLWPGNGDTFFAWPEIFDIFLNKRYKDIFALLHLVDYLNFI